MQIFLVCAITLLAGALGLGVFISRSVINKPASEEEDTLREGQEEGEITSEFWQLPRREFLVASPSGYYLRTLEINPRSPGDMPVGTVLFVHGITSNWHGMIKYMQEFINRGWQIFTYNQRNHHGSGGRSKTYGFYEQDDLKAVIDYIFEYNPEQGISTDQPFVLYGESMGAATILQYRPDDPRISLRINDCSFSDLREVVGFTMAQMGIPKLFRPVFIGLGSFMTWVRQGFFFFQVSPRRAVTTMKCPVLTMHGEDDLTSPSWMAKELHTALQESPAGERCKIKIFPGTGHARSVLEHPKEYKELLWSFIDSVYPVF